MLLISFHHRIENLLVKIRDIFWLYPDLLFFGKRSVASSIYSFYIKSRPFSHIISTVLIFVAITSIVLSNISAFLLIDKNTFIEGVIVGQNEKGELQKVLSVNPLIVTNIQLRRDLAELIYEPLLKVNQSNEKVLILAESFADIGEGKTYRFKLKENVLWHDGEEFTADDVIATFELLKTLEYGSQTTSVYSRAANKIIATKIDKYRVEFSLEDKNTVIPNFFEVISFKILPKHKIDDLNVGNILYSSPNINRYPVGTGPFKVGPLNQDKVELEVNDLYYGKKPMIKHLVFKLYRDQEKAIDELKTGQIHSIIGINSDSLQDLTVVPNLEIYKGNIVYNQYWGLYFNLSESGNQILKDVNTRKAIDMGINKKLVVETLVGSAVEANGPIPETSFAYSAEASRRSYDKDAAIQLLEKAGWVVSEDSNFRIKDGVALELSIVYVANPDRDKVVKMIVEDLEEIGVKVIPIAKTINEVNNDHLLPAYFDLLLYGVSTFIDPDRYELFHSSQIGYPNLNISSYKSTEETVIIVQGKKVTKSKVDLALEKGRSLISESARKEEYDQFQKLVIDDVPVIFLYHPVYTYIVNKRINGLTLNNMTALEDRFNNISNWYIEI